MGRPEKHEEEGDKIERRLVEAEAHLRKPQVTHDEAIQARDTGYWLFNGYDIWTMSMEPREGASPSEKSVIYGMRDRIMSRMSKINSALSYRASKLNQAAVERAEADWLGQTTEPAPSAPAKPANACDWCGADNGERKLIEEGPAKGLRLCARCRN